MKQNKKAQNTSTSIGIAIFMFMVIVGIFIAASGFDTVDASHKGVKVKFGEIQGTMEPGMQWTGMFVDVHQYNLRTRKLTVDMQGNQGSVDKDGQSVYATIQINYKLKGTDIENVYSNVGRDINNNLELTLNIDGIIREGFKSVTSGYTSLEIFQKRQEIKEKALEKIQANFPSDYFYLENVILSNIDFNQAFKQAIENRKVAEETAKAESEKVKIAEAQANIKIAQEEGNKAAQILQAEAQKESDILAADAKAYQILTEAESEAQGLKLKREQITPLMVQNNQIDMMRDTWSGNYPQWVTGDSMNMLMNMQPPGDVSNE